MDKKTSILYLLDILREDSDETHPLRSEDIVEKLAQRGVECERKTVGRNLTWLSEAGYDIVREHRGAYLATRKFTDEELRLLIDGVLASPYLCRAHSDELIEKLRSEGTPTLRETVLTDAVAKNWEKSDNREFLLTVSVVTEAIDQNKKVTFVYNEYDAEKKLRPRRPERYVVSPYETVFHNRRYYMLCNEDCTDDLRFFRIDYMSDTEIDRAVRRPRETVPQDHRLTPGEIAGAFPYPFHDRLVNAAIRIERPYLNDAIDWFGKKAAVREKDDCFIVRVKASGEALRYWLLQYGLHATLIEPQALVEQLRLDTETLYRRYHGEPR